MNAEQKDTPRRSLNFTSLDEVIVETNRLLAGGYTSTGNWDLAQASAHLTDWMSFAMDGYPAAPLPIRMLLWLMKVTSGKRQLKSVLSNGFRDRLPTMPSTVHPADETTDAAAVGELTEMVRRFKDYTGPIAPSPLYGRLTTDEAVQLQLVHCAHHLRFLSPKA